MPRRPPQCCRSGHSYARHLTFSGMRYRSWGSTFHQSLAEVLSLMGYDNCTNLWGIYIFLFVELPQLTFFGARANAEKGGFAIIHDLVLVLILIKSILH